MEKNKKPISNLTLCLETLITSLEQNDAAVELSRLKHCYAEAVRITQTDDISGMELAELGAKVRSSVSNADPEVSEQVLKISLGYNLLSGVA